MQAADLGEMKVGEFAAGPSIAGTDLFFSHSRMANTSGTENELSTIWGLASTWTKYKPGHFSHRLPTAANCFSTTQVEAHTASPRIKAAQRRHHLDQLLLPQVQKCSQLTYRRHLSIQCKKSVLGANNIAKVELESCAFPFKLARSSDDTSQDTSVLPLRRRGADLLQIHLDFLGPLGLVDANLQGVLEQQLRIAAAASGRGGPRKGATPTMGRRVDPGPHNGLITGYAQHSSGIQQQPRSWVARKGLTL